MIRDRLVVGLADVALSECLQMDPDLTLQRAVEKARNSELVKKQQGTIRNANHKKESQQGCFWCGSTTAHDRSKCPANKSKCHKCGKLGHFKKVCRSRGVKAVELDNSDYVPSSSQQSGYFLGTVSSNFNSTKPMIDVLVNGVNVKFRVDTDQWSSG